MNLGRLARFVDGAKFILTNRVAGVNVKKSRRNLSHDRVVEVSKHVS